MRAAATPFHRRRHLVIAVVMLCAVSQARDAQTGAESRCTKVCAEMAARIRSDPRKLVMAVEDALVMSEPCTSEIIATAIDAVNAEPRRVQRIWECAMKIVPHRVFEIQKAVANFRVPRAAEFKEPPLEVRRASIPSAPSEPATEVRRAESADAKAEGPITEVRRAEVPAEEVRKARPTAGMEKRAR